MVCEISFCYILSIVINKIVHNYVDKLLVWVICSQLTIKHSCHYLHVRFLVIREYFVFSLCVMFEIKIFIVILANMFSGDKPFYVS